MSTFEVSCLSPSIPIWHAHDILSLEIVGRLSVPPMSAYRRRYNDGALIISSDGPWEVTMYALKSKSHLWRKFIWQLLRQCGDTASAVVASSVLVSQ